MGERTHKRRYSSVYPSVSLVCFPMSQSIFILSLCSSNDLQRRSLLIPSASSLWSHYKPHIYLIEPAACLPACCLPACLDSCRPECLCVSLCPRISVGVRVVCVCETPYLHILACAVLICAMPVRVREFAVYYLTWGSKMSECKMSQVTYFVSWLLRRPAGHIRSLFSISLTCTLHHKNPQYPTYRKKTLIQS